MSRLAIIAALLLAGCASEADRAERAYEIVAENGVPWDECSAARNVADAYLAEGDEANYRDWKLTEDLACQTAANML